MALCALEPSQATLHGQYNRDLPPALEVDVGDTIQVRTLDVAWGMGQHPGPDEKPWRPKFEPRQSPRDDGPCLCGPIFVRGLRPGDTLALHIEALRPADWGWTWCGPGGFHQEMLDALGLGQPPGQVLRWTLDPDAMRAVSELGHRVALRPFLGMTGLCPGQPGWHSGWPPRQVGGNLDCKEELVAGSILYLPVEVEGGLLSLGDAHGRQGDGESAGSAIECPMERVVVRPERCAQPLICALHADTPGGWVTFGLDQDLQRATFQALGAMLDLLQAKLGCPRREALLLASVVVDLRITQLVNGVRGVHAVLPHDALLSA